MRPGIKLLWLAALTLFALFMVAVLDGRDTLTFFDSPLMH